MPPKDKYTDPELRDQVKEEIQNSDKGGAPGQWSARKAQFMASEYKKRGGGYTTDKKDDSAKHLDKWNEEDWQTKDGEGKAKQDDGTEKRYLPKKAWENMTEEEKEETDKKKVEGSKEGKQFVGNTSKAKNEGRQARNGGKKDDDQEEEKEDQDEEEKDEEEDDEQEEKKSSKNGNSAKKGSQQKKGQSNGQSQKKGQQNGQKKSQHKNAKKQDDKDEEEDDAAKEDDDEEEYVDDGAADDDKDGDEEMADEVGVPENGKAKEEDDEEEDEDEEDDKENTKAGQKRKADDKKQSNGSSKKQKSNTGDGTVGSKHMDAKEPAPRGSKDKLPKKGQKASWKALPGYVDGEVVDVIMEDKEIDGKMQKASKDNPKIILKSDSSGKICTHKPDSCFYYI